MTSETPKARKKRLNRERMRRYRENQRNEARFVGGPVCNGMIGELIDADRLLECESENPKEIFDSMLGVVSEFLASIKKKRSV
ncbi:hypothetical protein [Bradyrhizobium sp. NBAIM01]|uniref:hypothetical protein n=1 Tax=Bradyrhizobium sp. NBAIM01 TaxID=2793818 RepID=UPI001CD33050|nr:hypothetical protein [Bradyrhizobium sp. NBAIM01]MCA1512675.1 hypothetical protein [Bradyrhizobium sp. NBAIM01]